MKLVTVSLLIALLVSLTACSHNSINQPESFYEKEKPITKPEKPYTEDKLIDYTTAQEERIEKLEAKIDALNPFR